MPTTQTDYSFSDLTTRLEDNNVGAISESDVRSIVEFARVHGSIVSFTEMPTASLDWYGSATSATASNPPLSLPLYGKTSTTPNINSADISYVGVLDSTGYITHSSSAAGGVKYDDVVANVPRIFNYNWDAHISAQSDGSYAIVFYYLTAGGDWGVAGEMQRHVVSRFEEVVSGARGGPTLYERRTNGASSIILAPGDTLVPTLEYYGPDANPNTLKVSFTCNVISAGVVPAAIATANDYWDSVNEDKWDTDNPFTNATTYGFARQVGLTLS